MNVELTIQDCYNSYPCLFKERADVLNHLFCVIGNGCKWVNGELVEYELSEDEVKILEAHLVDGKAFQHNKLSLRAESKLYEDKRIAEGWYEEWHRRHPDDDIEEMKSIRQKKISKLPDDVYYKEPRKKRWYFYVNSPDGEYIDFCENFAFLFNYPDDIKADWRDAIEECKRMLTEDGFELPFTR